MKKLLIGVLCAAMVFAIAGCGSQNDTDTDVAEDGGAAEEVVKTEADSTKIDGMWAWIGYVEAGNELSAENAVIDEAFAEGSDLEELLESSIVIGEEGLSEGFDMPGSTMGERENTENGFTQDVTITELDGETLAEPIVITYKVSLIDNLLFVEESISDPTYTPSDVNVFKKVMD